MFAKVSLSSGQQVIIWMKIIRAIYWLKNDYEQIYFFVNSSSSNSYQLTQMSANLRNRRFSEISDPGVESFALFLSNFSVNDFCFSLSVGGKPSTMVTTKVLMKLPIAVKIPHRLPKKSKNQKF